MCYTNWGRTTQLATSPACLKHSGSPTTCRICSVWMQHPAHEPACIHQSLIHSISPCIPLYCISPSSSQGATVAKSFCWSHSCAFSCEGFCCPVFFLFFYSKETTVATAGNIFTFLRVKRFFLEGTFARENS